MIIREEDLLLGDRVPHRAEERRRGREIEREREGGREREREEGRGGGRERGRDRQTDTERARHLLDLIIREEDLLLGDRVLHRTILLQHLLPGVRPQRHCKEDGQCKVRRRA